MKLGIGKLVDNEASEHLQNIDSLDDFINRYPDQENFLVCECSCVDYQTISQFLANNPSAGLEDLKKSLKVGVGCGSCVKTYEFLNKLK